MSDSIWATVLGMARMFNSSVEYALYDISYANAMLYSKAMPMFGDGDGAEHSAFDESLDANNPDNFADFTEDEEIVRI